MFDNHVEVVPILQTEMAVLRSKNEVPFAFGNVPRIKKKLRSIVPKGTTPIARSLSRASTDFPPCENCRNVIILITDGIEACDER